ncbi:hypothetical protein [Saccharopolyspora shandongensis]|uniref:hypothetical protein n=1 Tax=Saccharopolyspora shandongensis TaxID=418495 RepID=UPI0033F59867
MVEQAPRSDELLERVTRQEREMVDGLRELFDRHAEVRVQDKDTAARLVASTVELTVHQLIASPLHRHHATGERARGDAHRLPPREPVKIR